MVGLWKAVQMHAFNGFADTCVFPTASWGGHFVVVRLMKPLAHKVDFQSPFVGTPATDNYIYSSPLAVTFIQLI